MRFALTSCPARGAGMSGTVMLDHVYLLTALFNSARLGFKARTICYQAGLKMQYRDILRKWQWPCSMPGTARRVLNCAGVGFAQ